MKIEKKIPNQFNEKLAMMMVRLLYFTFFIYFNSFWQHHHLFVCLFVCQLELVGRHTIYKKINILIIKNQEREWYLLQGIIIIKINQFSFIQFSLQFSLVLMNLNWFYSISSPLIDLVWFYLHFGISQFSWIFQESVNQTHHWFFSLIFDLKIVLFFIVETNDDDDDNYNTH